MCAFITSVPAQRIVQNFGASSESLVTQSREGERPSLLRKNRPTCSPRLYASGASGAKVVDDKAVVASLPTALLISKALNSEVDTDKLAASGHSTLSALNGRAVGEG
jgi:hypothetical protein